MVKRIASSATSASDIARYFLWCASRDGKRMTNKKLQKLVYYAQAWHLVINGGPLFEERIEAWIHGPVVFKVYDEYKKYGFGSIEEKISEADIRSVPSQGVLDEVWQIYGGYDANYLERLTHSETPWQTAREDMEIHERSNSTITHESMRTFYKPILDGPIDGSSEQ